ncbi:MAG TPA: AMP-binding protein [Myxococcales bacterium]|nr:AMP-binding protein [Myxococcales bacterium]
MADHSGPPLPTMPFESLPQLIAAQAGAAPDRAAVKQRGPTGKWQELTWRALDEKRRAYAAGLQALGVKRGDVIATVSPNSSEMLIAELAAQTLGAASAAIFPGYSQEILLHCVADSGARIAFAGSAQQQRQLAEARGLTKIVVLDGQPLPEDRAIPLQALQGGKAAELEATKDDVAYLLYTSGTTGKPKGVELTHWNALSQQAAIASLWDVSEKDIFLSYLPWHHCFGALFERLMALWHRALLVIDDSRGRDLDRLYTNLFEIRPTVYFGVPRVYNGMIARAEEDPKAREALKNLRFAFSAAAPISEPAFRWFEALGVPVLEGWGLTETSPCVTITRRSSKRAPGLVGQPLPGTTVRLQPVEDFGGRGEILVQGPQVMRGYHNRVDETAKALAQGFLHSGDLGEWTEQGLKLAGRIDGVFKLENGEKVSSGEVEARVLAATPLVEQALVLGSGQQFVTALLWLAPGAARAFLQQQELEAPSDFSAVPELRRAVVEALQAANLLAPVHYERVRRVAFMQEPLAFDSGELTPTQKVVRSVVMQKNAALIAALRSDQPHPQIAGLFRRGAAFENI